MLKLIGMGLWDEMDISLRGIEEAKACSRIFVEYYTTRERDTSKLEKLVGKKIEVIGRKEMEEESKKLLEMAKNEDVCVFVGGDPLTATTHEMVVIEAKKKGIETKIIHGASIYSAIAKSGLFVYKFGYTITLPKWLDKPESVFEKIRENKEKGWHTLLLIDIMMPIEEAQEKLKTSEFFDEFAVACSKMGSAEEKIVYKKIKDMKASDVFAPFVLLIPGKLHFMEEEALSFFSSK